MTVAAFVAAIAFIVGWVLRGYRLPGSSRLTSQSERPKHDASSYDDLAAETRRYKHTLIRIRDEEGKVCDRCSTCSTDTRDALLDELPEHPACASSYESWSLASKTLMLEEVLKEQRVPTTAPVLSCDIVEIDGVSMSLVEAVRADMAEYLMRQIGPVRTFTIRRFDRVVWSGRASSFDEAMTQALKDMGLKDRSLERLDHPPDDCVHREQ